MINIGLIGYGPWGKNYEKTMNHMGLNFIISTKNYEQDILKNKKIDGVIIATPVSTHYEIAKKSLEYDKNVLVEKPFTSTSEQALDLLKIKGGNILMVGHLYLHHPAINSMKTLLGEANKINWIEMTRLGGKENTNSLWDLGSHDLYILDYLFSQDPISIESYESAECHKIVINYPEFYVNLKTSVKSKNKIRDIVISTNNGIISFDDTRKNKLIHIKRSGEVDIIDLDERITPLEKQIKGFIHSIESKETPFNNGLRGLKNIRILEKINKIRNE